MGQRIGSFKVKNGAQLVVWENQGKLTFEFSKHYQEKQTKQWKQTKVLFLEELRPIGEMFLRAAEWGVKKNAAQPLPKNVEAAKTVTENVIQQVKERYERSSQDD
jgi:hypothetical protein